MELDIFHKPNQLILIDRTKFTRFQIEASNKLMKVAQDFVYNNKEELSDKDIVRKVYAVPVNDILYGRNRDSLKYVKEKVLELSDVGIETFDNNEFGILKFFPYVGFDAVKNEFKFTLNVQLIDCYINNTSLIIPDGIKREGIHNTPYYTDMDLRLQRNFKGADVSFHLLEYVARYIGFNNNKEEGGFINSIPVKQFKRMIGLEPDSYKRNSNFKTVVLDRIIKDFKVMGIELQLEMLGRGKNLHTIRVKISDNSEIEGWLQDDNKTLEL